MADRPKVHHCSKCGCIVDPKTMTTLSIQSHSLSFRKHWRTGEREQFRKTTSVIPQVKLCDECEGKAAKLLNEWMECDGLLNATSSNISMKSQRSAFKAERIYCKGENNEH